MRGVGFTTGLALAMALAAPSLADAPRIEDFVSPPAVSHVHISPSGRYFTAVTQVDNRDTLAVFDTEALDAAPVGVDIEDVAFQWVEWASEERILVNVFDGLQFYSTTYWVHLEPRYRTIAMNRDGSNQVVLFEGVYSRGRRAATRERNIGRVTDILRSDPEHVLMPAIRGSDVDLFRVNVYSGAARRVERGRRRTVGWVTDVEGQPVVRIDSDARNAALNYYTRAPGDDEWTHVMTVPERDRGEFSPVAASDQPGVVYAVARPDEAERAGVYLFNVATGQFGRPVASHPRVDIRSVIYDATTGRYLGASYVDDRLRYQFDDPEVQAHFDALDEFFGREANIRVVDANADRSRLILHVSGPHEPGSYNLYDVEEARVTRLADTHPRLAGVGNRVEVLRYPASDGVEITGYLTMPEEAEEPAPALIVMPHGGPELRDSVDFDVQAQFLASRGYAVFQPNFRGSSGYGVAFTEAGRRQWGGAMQDDVTDGVDYLIETGRIDPDRICIYGASYGGYAAMMGAALTPDRYRCAASRSGLSDLRAFMVWLREAAGETSDEYAYWLRLIGDPVEDRARLDATSPRRLAAAVTAPVLLLHGAEDNIVPPQQSELMREALIEAGASVHYFEFAGAGHNDWPVELEARAFRELELFFASHLGGETGPEPDYARLSAIDRGTPPWLAREFANE